MKECSICQSCFPDSVEYCEHDGQPVKLTLPVESVIKERYRLEKRIGHGSVSIVYFGYDLILDRTCAVRIILPDLIGSDAEMGERFLHDATATSAIRHPNIVAVTDSGMLNGVVPFIVMEYVSGRSLQDILSINGALPPSGAFEYASTIGSGLAAAHKLGIVHGDLKPRNILIDKDHAQVETIKISDFGLSQLKSGKLYGPLAVPKSTGMLRSPLYLAPEEWSDGESDNRSDIYSLGVILYQMLAGDVPFKGKSIPAIMKQHLMNPPPSIAGSSSSISSQLEAVVLHALQKDPAERPDTIEHFIEELGSAVKGVGAPKSIRSARVSPKKVRRPIAKARKIAQKKDHAPVEVRKRSVEVKDSQQFAEDITIVNYVAFDEVLEPPHTDLDQTISDQTMFVSKGGVSGDVLAVGREDEVGADEPGTNKLVVTEPDEGGTTLVDYPAFNEVNDPPQTDFDQTIVIAEKCVDSDELIPAAGNSEVAADELARYEPAVTEPGESGFDMTIVPGMNGYPTFEGSRKRSESTNEPRLDIETDEQLSRDPEPESIAAGLQNSAFAIPAYEAENLPRTIPPILLAAGVILVVLLIGVGVYYSHVSQ